MTARLLILGALSLLLAACVGQPVRSRLPQERVAAAEASQLERESRLRQRGEWSLAGRIAVSNEGKGGSGRVEWEQAGPRFEVSLSAPVTRQSWRVTGDGSGAQLEGLDGGVRSGSDARLLLLQATGWDIPVIALADWVRGLRAAELGPGTVIFGTDMRPARIEQGGWAIDYEWPPESAPDALPARLDARRGEARVRLIIDEWNAVSNP